jgi:hypothetical protein
MEYLESTWILGLVPCRSHVCWAPAKNCCLGLELFCGYIHLWYFYDISKGFLWYFYVDSTALWKPWCFPPFGGLWCPGHRPSLETSIWLSRPIPGPPQGLKLSWGIFWDEENHWVLGNSLEIEVLMGEFFINGKIRLIIDVLMGWK